MPVSEEVKVLPLARGPVLHPIFPVRIHRYEYLAGAFVQDGPAVTGNNTLVERFPGIAVTVFCPLAVLEFMDIIKAVQGSGGALQIA